MAPLVGAWRGCQSDLMAHDLRPPKIAGDTRKRSALMLLDNHMRRVPAPLGNPGGMSRDEQFPNFRLALQGLLKQRQDNDAVGMQSEKRRFA